MAAYRVAMTKTSKITATNLKASDGDTSCGKARTKRSRGRPKGSGGFEEKDQKVLRVLADRCAREPTTVPTQVFKGLGYQSRSELARLSAKWRRRKGRMIPEAQQRLEATRDLSPLGGFVAWMSSFSLHLDAWIACPVGKDFADAARGFQSSIAEGTDAAFARHALDREAARTDGTAVGGTANGKRVGSDAEAADDDPEALEGELDPACAQGSKERFENRAFQTMEDLAATFDRTHTMADLPVSQKFYAMALFYHELSLQAERQEQAKTDEAAQSMTQTTARSYKDGSKGLDDPPAAGPKGDVQ